MEFEESEKRRRQLSMQEFGVIWNRLADMNRLNGNAYRILFHLLFEGGGTQTEISTARNWKFSSVSNTLRRLYDIGIVNVVVKDRKMMYVFNFDEELLTNDSHNGISINDELTKEILRKKLKDVSEITTMSANLFRVYVDILLYGCTTRKELWERRGWKIDGVNKAFQKLMEMNLLKCEKKDNKNVYSVK